MLMLSVAAAAVMQRVAELAQQPGALARVVHQGDRGLHVLERLAIAPEIRVQNFDRDRSSDARVLAAIHAAHATGAEDRVDPIASVEDAPDLHDVVVGFHGAARF